MLAKQIQFCFAAVGSKRICHTGHRTRSRLDKRLGLKKRLDKQLGLHKILDKPLELDKRLDKRLVKSARKT